MSRIIWILLLGFAISPAPAAAQLVDQYGDPLPPGAIARLGTVRFRHGMFVYAAAFTSDGRRLVSFGSSGGGPLALSLVAWDTATGKRERLGQFGHQTNSFPIATAFCADCKVAATAGSAGGGMATIILIDVGTGREMWQTVAHKNPIFCFAFSPDGKTLASGGLDGSIRLSEVATGAELRLLEGHGEYVSRLAFSDDGKTLAAAGSDKTLRLWDPASGKELAKQAEQTGLRSMAFAPDGKTLAWPAGEAIRLWDFATGKEDRTLQGQPLTATYLTYSPDGKTLIAGDDNGSVSVWDVAAGKETRRWPAHGHSISSIRFAPDGRTFVSLSAFEGGLRIWRLPEGTEDNLLPVITEGAASSRMPMPIRLFPLEETTPPGNGI